MGRSLVLYSSSDDILGEIADSDYSYSIGQNTIDVENELSDVNRFNDIVEGIRDEYSEWVSDHSNKFNKLKFDNTSIFHFTDFFGKRTEFFPTVKIIAHCLFLKEVIEKEGITHVSILNATPLYGLIISKYIKSLGNIEVIYKIEKLKDFKKRYILQNIYFFITLLVKKLILLFNSLKKEADSRLASGRVFLTRYPLHLKDNKHEDKYNTMIQNDDTVLVDVITDGLHQNLGLKEYFKKLRDFRQNFGPSYDLLDDELRFVDIIKGVFYFLYIETRSFTSFRDEFIFKGIDVSQSVQREIKYSLLRIPRLYCLHIRIKRYFQKKEVRELVYYLHEYSYGRTVSYTLKEYFPKVKRIGFQHGPASLRKFLYFMSPKDFSAPVPDCVLAEDVHSKRVYELGGYRDVDIMPEIYRLSYLREIKRLNIKVNTVLIACGLHDGLFLFEKMKYRIKTNPQVKFILKLHPRANNKVITQSVKLEGFSNLEVGTLPIQEYLSFVEKVVVTYSSVGLEARELGIDVEVMRVPGTIDESPLMDIGGV